MTSQLQIYNEALVLRLGERKIASLTEAREPRRVLDDIWDQGARKYCLEQGHWKFAQRVAKLNYSTDVTPTFGYNRAFEKPSDCVKISMLCADAFFKAPLLSYSEETSFWFAEIDSIYISYVSDDPSYGYNLSAWPETFTRYMAAYMALMAAPRITQNKTDVAALKSIVADLKKDALSKDAIQGPTKFLPPGQWVQSRGGGGNSGRNSNSSLMGT